DIRRFAFFFCQLDAIETIIWLAEAPDAEKTGINIEGDGGSMYMHQTVYRRWQNDRHGNAHGSYAIKPLTRRINAFQKTCLS
ncbi:MAG: hypothetical protein LBT13_06840, partial [Treponema sp.]|nr:hypothetical protein [Treponema sp.]